MKSEYKKATFSKVKRPLKYIVRHHSFKLNDRNKVTYQ